MKRLSILLKALFLPIIFLLLLNSCGRCIHCRSSSGGVLFYGFSKAEMGEVMVKEYIRSGSSPTLDSFTRVPAIYNGDTTVYYADEWFILPPSTLDSAVVYIFADSLSYKLTNFAFDSFACSQCPDMKLYKLKSYYVNGVKDSAVAVVNSVEEGSVRIRK